MIPLGGQQHWTVNKSHIPLLCTSIWTRKKKQTEKCSYISAVIHVYSLTCYLKKSNYFEGCCFCWRQFLKSLRSLKMLPVVKWGWSTSLWVMALMQFPSCQPLSISLMSRSQSLWYLCKAGKLHAHFRNGVAHRQRDRWLLRLHRRAGEELSWPHIFWLSAALTVLSAPLT